MAQLTAAPAIFLSNAGKHMLRVLRGVKATAVRLREERAPSEMEFGE